MRPLDLMPRVEEITPEPATDLPAFMVHLAVNEEQPSPGWAELRTWLAADRGISADDAETLILEALRAEDLRARLNFEQDAWEVRVSATAARAVLLRYALNRMAAAGLDLDDFADYREEDDRDVVLGMMPELVPLSEGETPPARPATYRRLLTGGVDA